MKSDLHGNYPCGSKTLYKKGKDAVCMKCGYVIKEYISKELEMGAEEFKKFEKGLHKYKHRI